MGFIEALVLLSVGVFAGILSTVFDVLVSGTASFVSHFALWVLFNALVAVHVESRLRAILWAIPFNFGYIESYFMTTVASFECYQKSLVVPLAAVALISPLLNYALWTAKKENNVYGRVLSVAIVAGTLVSSYLVNGKLGVYDFVICAILAYVLLFMPVRRLKISRGIRPFDPAAQEAALADGVGAVRGGEKASKGARRPFSFGRKKDKPKHEEQTHRRKNVYEENAYVTAQKAQAEHEQAFEELEPTKRARGEAGDKPKRFSFMRRRAERKQEDAQRERRLRAASQKRARRRSQDAEEDAGASMSTLGNARRARRSSRS